MLAARRSNKVKEIKNRKKGLKQQQQQWLHPWITTIPLPSAPPLQLSWTALAMIKNWIKDFLILKCR